MGKFGYIRLAGVSAAALLSGLAISQEANAGAFGIREQSAYFGGMAYAGSAAGGDISSMFWNSAATAELPGFNTSSNYAGIFGTADMHAASGSLVNGQNLPAACPPGPATSCFVHINALTPTSDDVGTDALVASTFATYQLSERLYAGVGITAPDGLVTKGANWAGSPIAVTSKVFSIDVNPTLAYKLTPQITVGVGLQVEYFKIRLTHHETDGTFNAVVPGVGVVSTPVAINGARSYKADGWGLGASAGVLWRPREGTTLGLGYRSAIGVDVSGKYNRGASISATALSTDATGSLTLPDEVTLSIRQNVSPRMALLGTVEWQNWSQIQNIVAAGSGCGASNKCETLNLNYRDGWLFSAGAEYLYSPTLTLRTGFGYETSPMQDQTRDILLPDSNRWHLSAGASYRYSDRLTVNLGYDHLFFDDAPFCMATTNTALNPSGTTHCDARTNPAGILLKGDAAPSVDIVTVGMNYKMSGPAPALEPYK
jgi:long-chain fatty acid transport protein